MGNQLVTHNIVVTDVNKSEDNKILISKGFRKLFSRPSLNWFEEEVRKQFPGAKRYSDKSLVGFHYDYKTYLIELM